MIETVLEAIKSISTAYTDYPNTNAKPPYMVVRMANSDPREHVIGGKPLMWEHEVYVNCVGASISASRELASRVIELLTNDQDGKNILYTGRIEYSGQLVDGLYESAVVLTIMTGEFR